MNATEARAIITELGGSIGESDSEKIEAAMGMLLEIDTYLSGVETEIAQLQDDVERLNERNIGLQAANNKALRMLNSQKETMEKAAEEMSYSANFANHFAG